MKKSTILKYVLNCFLLFILPLLMMVFGNQLPPALLAENFSKDIPPVIEFGDLHRRRHAVHSVLGPLDPFSAECVEHQLDRVFGNGLHAARVADRNRASGRFILFSDTLQALVLYLVIHCLHRFPSVTYDTGVCANLLTLAITRR